MVFQNIQNVLSILQINEEECYALIVEHILQGSFVDGDDDGKGVVLDPVLEGLSAPVSRVGGPGVWVVEVGVDSQGGGGQRADEVFAVDEEVGWVRGWGYGCRGRGGPNERKS